METHIDRHDLRAVVLIRDLVLQRDLIRESERDLENEACEMAVIARRLPLDRLNARVDSEFRLRHEERSIEEPPKMLAGDRGIFGRKIEVFGASIRTPKKVERVATFENENGTQLPRVANRPQNPVLCESLPRFLDAGMVLLRPLVNRIERSGIITVHDCCP
jgi:hypothetical protein